MRTASSLWLELNLQEHTKERVAQSNSLFLFFTMSYDSIIYQTLVEADGRDLSIHKIALHVCNASNSLFGSVDYEDVHAYVAQFLRRVVKNGMSGIVRGKKRGEYRLDLNTQQGQHLFLRFSEEEPEDQPTPQTNENDERHLSLFGEI